MIYWKDWLEQHQEDSPKARQYNIARVEESKINKLTSTN